MKIVKVLTIALSLLCIPLIGMIAFPSEVKWTLFDFLVAFMFLSLGVFLISYINRVARQSVKVIYITLIIIIMALLWMELAVGIFGSFLAGS
ncbi:MAG: hypothetical protein RJA11_1774 [Bacteroidota bacterium]|jgi:hypothetical protein